MRPSAPHRRNLAALGLFSVISLAAVAGPNEDAAFRSLFPKAESGNADAQFALGKIYLDGSSSAGKDTAKGFEYINRAANAGNKPAMRLIVDRVESRGIEMCLKLQKAGDNYCDSKMDGMVKRLIPKTPTAASCKRLEEIHTAGIKVEAIRFEVAHCVVLGLSAAMNPTEASSVIRTESLTGRAAFIKGLDIVLKQGTPDWDPLFVEDNLTKVGLTFKDKEVVASFGRNGVSMDGCRRLDPLRRETLKQRPALCRMAGKSGDGDAALYVGEAYLTGRDYFPKDSAAAAEFIAEAQTSADSRVATEAFSLLLTLYKSEGRLYDHLALVDREITRRTVHMPAAIAALPYEFDFLVRSHANMKLEDITAIVALAELPQVAAAQKVRVAHAIDDIVKDRGELLKRADLEMLKRYRVLLAGEPPAEAVSKRTETSESRDSRGSKGYGPTLDQSRQPESAKSPEKPKAAPVRSVETKPAETKQLDATAELNRLISGLKSLIRNNDPKVSD